MNILFEESGGFKVGAVLADNTTSMQVETPHGKRSKVKANAVLLQFNEPPLAQFLGQAEEMASQIDIDFLWQCCDTNEFGFDDLAREYFGHPASPLEATSILLRLYSAPIYFYRKGKGKFKAAPAETLKAALAAVERKRQQQLTIDRMIEELKQHKLPPEFGPLVKQLLYQPDGNRLETKALQQASDIMRLPVPRLLEKCGALSGSYDYHLGKFLYEYFPSGTEVMEAEEIFDVSNLPQASVTAFSIDDVTTTEIDDAFSVEKLESGGWRVGIHIALPSSGFRPGSPLGAIARQRLSTVYLPGQKITMLPEATIARFSLVQGKLHPALSLYLELNATDFSVVSTATRIERIYVNSNLNHSELDPVFTESNLNAGSGDYPFKPELTVLWRLSKQLELLRDCPIATSDRPEYSFYVNDDRIKIVERKRGQPLDKLVAELMIYVNSTWGKLLADSGITGIYRGQLEGVVKMTTMPVSHEGLGVSQYIWASSPIRRYIDLINQWQLIAYLQGEPPPFAQDSEELLTAIRDFEMTYAAYNEFQNTMERYWCLRWLIQEKISQAQATLIKENLVKFSGIPLYTRVPTLPELASGSDISIEVVDVDLWDLTVRCQFREAVKAEEGPSI